MLVVRFIDKSDTTVVPFFSLFHPQGRESTHSEGDRTTQGRARIGAPNHTGEGTAGGTELPPLSLQAGRVSLLLDQVSGPHNKNKGDLNPAGHRATSRPKKQKQSFVPNEKKGDRTFYIHTIQFPQRRRGKTLVVE